MEIYKFELPQRCSVNLKYWIRRKSRTRRNWCPHKPEDTLTVNVNIDTGSGVAEDALKNLNTVLCVSVRNYWRDDTLFQCFIHYRETLDTDLVYC